MKNQKLKMVRKSTCCNINSGCLHSGYGDDDESMMYESLVNRRSGCVVTNFRSCFVLNSEIKYQALKRPSTRSNRTTGDDLQCAKGDMALFQLYLTWNSRKQA